MTEQPAILDEERIKSMIDTNIQTAIAQFVTQEQLRAAIQESEARTNTNSATLINGAIEGVKGVIATGMTGVNNKLSELNVWKDSVMAQVNSRDDQVRQLVLDHRDLEKTVHGLSEKQSEHRASIKALQTTLHGDPEIKDGQPSLYQMVKTLNDEVQTNNRLATQEIAQNSERLKSVEDHITSEKIKWKHRQEMLFKMVEWGLKTRTGQIIIVILMVTAVYILRPDIAVWLYENFGP